MKNQIKQWMVVCVMCMTGLSISLAQGTMPDDSTRKGERIESLKRAYITDELQLTVIEAEKFWPIYNNHEKQKRDLRKIIREKQRSLQAAQLNEKEALSGMEFIAQKQKEEVDLDMQLFRDCLPILGVSKSLKLEVAEREFQREMMRALKHKGAEKGEKAPKGGKGPKGVK